MGLIVEYRHAGPQLNITDAAAAVPEMRLTAERWRVEGDDVLTLFVVAEGEQFDEWETALRDLSNVESVETVSDRGTSRLYQIELISTGRHLPENSSINGFISHIRIEPDGLYITAYVAGRDEIVEIREFLTGLDYEMEVVRLQDATETDPGGGLTDEQFEALLTAYEMGYFEVPKRATQAEVADELGISSPSLSERLKRAQQGLIEQHLLQDRLLPE